MNVIERKLLNNEIKSFIKKVKAPRTLDSIIDKVFNLFNERDTYELLLDNQDFLQDCYNHLIDRNKYFELDRLIDLTGIIPSQDNVQKIYDYLLLNGRVDALKHYNDKFKIKPSFKTENLNKEYHEILEHEDIDKLSELIKITGINPELTEKEIKENYTNLLGLSKFSNFEDLLCGKSITNPYHEERLEKLTKLSKITGVEVSQELVQKVFNFLIKEGNWDYAISIHKKFSPLLENNLKNNLYLFSEGWDKVDAFNKDVYSHPKGDSYRDLFEGIAERKMDAAVYFKKVTEKYN